MALMKAVLTAMICLQSIFAQSRIRNIFDRYSDEFNANLLLEVFKEENGEEEFLLNETNLLI